MTNPARLDPPKGLKKAGKALWSQTMQDHKLRKRHQHELLQRACEQADRLDQIRELLAEQGLMVTDARGNERPNKLLVEERATVNVLRLTLRELSLDAKVVEESRLPRTRLYNANVAS